MNEILVRVENLSKKICKDRYLSMVYSLTDIMKNMCYPKKRPVALRKSESFALEDVSFSVKRGECLGVLGPNGAGKTTLLKLILEVLLPDNGKIITNGEIAGILRRGAGLNRDLTGEENIYFCCSLYKKSRSEITGMFNDIAETAELGKRIYDPLKTYSLGMFARLIFAITINIKADILLVDDVLQVGDLKFIKKFESALNRIKKNTALIIASHNIDNLLNQADKIIVLDKGHVKFFGEKTEAISYYYKMLEDNLSELMFSSAQ